MNRRSFLKGVPLAAAIPLIGTNVSAVPVDVAPSAPILGNVYTYTQLHIDAAKLRTMREADLREALEQEAAGSARDLQRAFDRYFTLDTWAFPDGREHLSHMVADDRFIHAPQPTVPGKVRYFQPTTADWMEHDRGLITRLPQEDGSVCWAATYFIYGVLQATPGQFPESGAAIKQLFLDDWMVKKGLIVRQLLATQGVRA